MSKNTIYLYQDEGAGALTFNLFEKALDSYLDHRYELKAILAHEVKKGSWVKNAALFILPGGRDIPYHQKLKGLGCDQIRSYVENGGSFLGVCAGAYFATQEVQFEKGTELEVHEHRELAFFQGISKGTLYPHKPFSYQGHDSAHAALICYKDQLIPVYYNGGCTFLEAKKDPKVEVLATFEDLENQPAAIVLCPIKKGLAILSGVHIEMASSFTSSNEKLYSSLKEKEPQREKLFDEIIQRLLR